MRMRCIYPIALSVLLPVLAAAQQPTLNPTNFIVLGEGLAAGMADFSLKDVYQDKSFPNQMATQMNVAFPQPEFQGSGVGNVPGFPALPVRYPGPGQTTVRADFPPQLFIFNLSIPGLRLADSLGRPPSPPLVQEQDMLQTVINLTLGYPALILKNQPLWNQLQYAQQMNPTLALIELGYYEALDAATSGDITRLPAPSAFASNYAAILKGLSGSGTVLVATTIPNPFDTGYFTPISGLSRLVPADTATIVSTYGLQPGDVVTINGVNAIANQMRWNETPHLPPGSVIGSTVQTQITSAVTALNSSITSAAQASGALVEDLNALFHTVRTSGLIAGSYVLTADHLGGFYSLDGFYPGWTGNAFIANDILNLFNQKYGMGYPTIGLAGIVQNDPAVRHSLQYSSVIPPVQP